MASRAGVLHQVEAGLGGVVAQRAIVDTRLRTERAVLLLQVLRIAKEESGNVRQCSRHHMVSEGSYTHRSISTFLQRYTAQFKYILENFRAQTVMKAFFPFNFLAPKLQHREIPVLFLKTNQQEVSGWQKQNHR